MKLIKKLLGMSKKSGRTTEQQVSRKELAKALAAKAKKYGRTIEQQEYRDGLAKRLKEARKCSSDLAKTLLETEKGKAQYIAAQGDEYLIKGGTIDILIKNIGEIKYNGCFSNKIAMELIKDGRTNLVRYNIRLFKNLNKTVAEYLIDRYGIFGEYILHVGKEERIEYIVKNIDKFNGLYHQEIVMELIKRLSGCYYSIVVDNFEKFKFLNFKKIAMELIKTSDGAFQLVKNLEKFKGLKHQEIVMELIKRGQGKYVALYFDKFSIGHFGKEIAWYLCEYNTPKLVENLHRCDGLGIYEVDIAKKLIKKGYSDVVFKNPEMFGLKKEKQKN